MGHFLDQGRDWHRIQRWGKEKAQGRLEIGFYPTSS